MSTSVTKWTPPNPDWIKLNCDGDYDDGTGKAGIGVVSRNRQGEMVAGYGRAICSNNALMMEMWLSKVFLLVPHTRSRHKHQVGSVDNMQVQYNKRLED